MFDWQCGPVYSIVTVDIDDKEKREARMEGMIHFHEYPSGQVIMILDGLVLVLVMLMMLTMMLRAAS